MLSSSFGKNLKVSIFGESHGTAIGAVIDGVPAGEFINFDVLQAFLRRRMPGQNFYSSPRYEEDIPEFLSGMSDNTTCGSPICFVIRNKNQKRDDYKKILDTPRPGHADYTSSVKYNKFNDVSGGGHFSGRLTAPICVVGGICKQILARKNIYIGAHIYSIKDVCDSEFEHSVLNKVTLESVSNKPFPTIGDNIASDMKNEILTAIKHNDSVGGVVECSAIGLPVGLGEPLFSGLENKISQAVFAIPGVKGIEFGSGFRGSKLYGSENNDEYFLDNDVVKTFTNNCGGILGGLSNGMPLVFKVAVKPTPSIQKEQNSVNLKNMRNEKIIITGRHDPCIVPRAVPCVEAITAMVILDFILEGV